MWQIILYEKANGRCPIKDFLDSLNRTTELPYVTRAITNLSKFGYRLGRPQTGYLGDDIYELRVRTENRLIRIFYFFSENEDIILTHGFIKKVREIPDPVKKQAMNYKEDYINSKKGKQS